MAYRAFVVKAVILIGNGKVVIFSRPAASKRPCTSVRLKINEILRGWPGYSFDEKTNMDVFLLYGLFNIKKSQQE